MKFCLLSLRASSPHSLFAARHSPPSDFVFFALHPDDLRDPERRFTLTPEDIALLNPNTRTCPIFRSKADAELTKAIYRRVPVLIKEQHGEQPEENPWGITFNRMFDMANDSHLFRTREQLEAEGGRLEGNIFSIGNEVYLPLYEAKLFHQYDHRFATYNGDVGHGQARDTARDMTDADKTDPCAVIIPRYWVLEENVEERLDNKVVMNNASDSRQQTADSRQQTRLLYHTQAHCTSHRSANCHQHSDSGLRAWPQSGRHSTQEWMLALRLITNTTNQRTVIGSLMPAMALGHKAAVVSLLNGLRLFERQQTQQMSEQQSQQLLRGAP